MTNYAAETYLAREPESVEACRFDGTHAHAAWFADQDPDVFTVLVALGDRARGLTDDSPAWLGVSCWDGIATAEKGDWIAVDEDADWRVCSDEGFQARWTPAE